MAKIGKKQYQQLACAEQLRIAKLPENQPELAGVRAQCLPHTRFDDLADSQWLQLVEVLFDWQPRAKLNGGPDANPA